MIGKQQLHSIFVTLKPLDSTALLSIETRARAAYAIAS